MKMQFSAPGRQLLKGFEGVRFIAYQDIDGIWTNGVGHTGPDVFPGQTVDEAQVDAWLDSDTATAVAFVNRVVTVTITQGEFDAMVDFAFNLGCGSLQRSTLLRDVDAGDFTDAAAQFALWNKAGGKENSGLTRRRAAEALMFEGRVS